MIMGLLDVRSRKSTSGAMGVTCSMMSWGVIVTKAKGEVGQELTGPFLGYDAAMGPASAYEHKYIEQIFSPAERLRI